MSITDLVKMKLIMSHESNLYVYYHVCLCVCVCRCRMLSYMAEQYKENNHELANDMKCVAEQYLQDSVILKYLGPATYMLKKQNAVWAKLLTKR